MKLQKENHLKLHKLSRSYKNADYMNLYEVAKNSGPLERNCKIYI